MKIIRTELTDCAEFSGFLERDSVILDIAATGRYWRTSQIETITLITAASAPFEITMGLEKEADEYDMLLSLGELLENAREIITFNGTAFDLPQIRHKLAAYGMRDPLVGKEFRDLFLEYRPLAGILGLPSRRLADYAAFFGSEDGGTDARRTLRLLAFDAFLDLLDGHFSLRDAASDRTPAAIPLDDGTAAAASDGSPSVLYYTLSLRRVFPGRISIHDGIYHLIVERDTARISVHLRDGRIRCYHTDTENYDYLPLEGYAIHRSMSAYVDKTRKEKAVRENCFHLIAYSISFLSDRPLIETYLRSALQYLRSR